MIFGASYRSAAILPDGTRPPEVGNPVSDYVAVARPGSRAPQVPLERDGERFSTPGLAAGGFTLLAGPAGAAWRDAARAGALGVPLHAFTVGPDGDLQGREDRWTVAYDVEPDGAVLVRPDGHVGWRRRSGVRGPGGELERVVHGMRGRAQPLTPSRGAR